MQEITFKHGDIVKINSRSLFGESATNLLGKIIYTGDYSGYDVMFSDEIIFRTKKNAEIECKKFFFYYYELFKTTDREKFLYLIYGSTALRGLK